MNNVMLGHLGFSYVGFLYLFVIAIPNIIWVRKSAGHDFSGENSVLLALERVGQILCVISLLIFSDTSPQKFELRTIWLIASVSLIVLYEWNWIRYFRSEKTLRDFYRTLFGIPVPGAVLPVAAFILLGVYGRLLWLIIAAVVFGIGHIGIHVGHVKCQRR